MDKQQKLQYQQEVESYLTNNHVYDLFEDLLKSLVVKQPADPITYLIEKLSNPQGKKIFIVGPPGFKVRQFALQVADHYKFTTISVGDLLRKQVTKKLELGQQIESYFKNYSLVKDQIVINIVKKQIQNMNKEKKSFILSGFPKTRLQALAMQKEGIFPDAFIILNMDSAKIELHCEQKFKSYQKILDKSLLNNKQVHIKNHSLEYSLNISQVKEIYKNNFFEIDCINQNRQQILQDIARLLKFKIKSKRPKRPASILLLSDNKDQRQQIGKKLAKRYGFVYVSARDILSQQISKNNEVGRLALNHVRSKALIDDIIMNGLVQSRLSQVDCQMQGFVLEGYPKTVGQAAALKDLYVRPSLIVSLSLKDNNTPMIKEINSKYQNVILKPGNLPISHIFQKICFQLENN